MEIGEICGLQLILWLSSNISIMNNSVLIIPLNKKEIKDLSIGYFFYETCYGTCVVASRDKGICYVGFGEKEPMLQSLRKHYPDARLTEQKADVHNAALRFIHNEEVKELPLHISGTDFQMNVWKALLEIPLGKTSSYSAVAQAVNNSKAVRAVGSAVGDNPVSYIIPCHRVIRSDGTLGGYFWGPERKKQMLDKERKICQ